MLPWHTISQRYHYVKLVHYVEDTATTTNYNVSLVAEWLD